MTIEKAKAELEKFVKLKTTMRPTFVDVLLDAEPVRHGHWIKQEYEDTDSLIIDGWECSVCGEGVVWQSEDDIKLEKYCYNCGAKMDEVEK